jgi:hypothetical protein
MKNLFLVVCFIIGFLLIPVTGLAAVSIVAEKVFDTVGVELYFISLAALAGAVLPVTELIKRLIGSSGNWTRYLSWIVAVLISLIGGWLNLGILQDLSLLWLLIYGVAAGLIANGVFNIETVRAILSAFKDKPERTK